MKAFESLRRRREFALAMRRGASASNAAFVIYRFAPKDSPYEPAKVGIVTTRKVGTAVVRNRLRRRCCALLAAGGRLERARWYVIVCKPEAAALPFDRLRTALDDALERARRPRPRRAA